VTVDLQWRRTGGDPPLSTDLHYRRLQWPEVQALARAEDVELSFTGDAAALAFPILE